LIDNKSDSVLEKVIDLSWHPHAVHIRENKLGLTHARLRGIQEAQSDLLIFVDDDNILDPNYLAEALSISENYPFLGAWGGQTIPEFEETPPEWTKPLWRMLAIHEFQGDHWSNLVNQYQTTPCGAGLCVRKSVAEQYAKLVRQDSTRLSMGRKGTKLTSYEDSDIAFTACDMGLGIGCFERLKLTHLIPSTRLEESYLLRLIESSVYSGTIVESYRGQLPTPPKALLGRIADWFRLLRMSPRDRRFCYARQRGLKSALQELNKLSS
jgi:hypothetical protein